MECFDCGTELPVACPDDMCRAMGECIHGDGYGPCRECRDGADEDIYPLED